MNTYKDFNDNERREMAHYIAEAWEEGLDADDCASTRSRDVYAWVFESNAFKDTKYEVVISALDNFEKDWLIDDVTAIVHADASRKKDSSYLCENRWEDN